MSTPSKEICVVNASRLPEFSPKEISAASKVRDNVSLIDIAFRATNTNCLASVEWIYNSLNHNQIKTESLCSVDVATLKPHKSDDFFYATCNMGVRDVAPWEIILPDDEKKEGNAVLYIVEAKIELTYKPELKTGLTKKGKEVFGALNGPFHAWAYWREFVQNATWRMGIPPVTLDTILPPSGKPTKKKKA